MEYQYNLPALKTPVRRSTRNNFNDSFLKGTTPVSVESPYSPGIRGLVSKFDPSNLQKTMENFRMINQNLNQSDR